MYERPIHQSAECLRIVDRITFIIGDQLSESQRHHSRVEDCINRHVTDMNTVSLHWDIAVDMMLPSMHFDGPILFDYLWSLSVFTLPFDTPCTFWAGVGISFQHEEKKGAPNDVS